MEGRKERKTRKGKVIEGRGKGQGKGKGRNE